MKLLQDKVAIVTGGAGGIGGGEGVVGRQHRLGSAAAEMHHAGIGGGNVAVGVQGRDGETESRARGEPYDRIGRDRTGVVTGRGPHVGSVAAARPAGGHIRR